MRKRTFIWIAVAGVVVLVLLNFRKKLGIHSVDSPITIADGKMTLDGRTPQITVSDPNVIPANASSFTHWYKYVINFTVNGGTAQDCTFSCDIKVNYTTSSGNGTVELISRNYVAISSTSIQFIPPVSNPKTTNVVLPGAYITSVDLGGGASPITCPASGCAVSFCLDDPCPPSQLSNPPVH